MTELKNQYIGTILNYFFKGRINLNSERILYAINEIIYADNEEEIKQILIHLK